MLAVGGLCAEMPPSTLVVAFVTTESPLGNPLGNPLGGKSGHRLGTMEALARASLWGNRAGSYTPVTFYSEPTPLPPLALSDYVLTVVSTHHDAPKDTYSPSAIPWPSPDTAFSAQYVITPPMHEWTYTNLVFPMLLLRPGPAGYRVLVTAFETVADLYQHGSTGLTPGFIRNYGRYYWAPHDNDPYYVNEPLYGVLQSLQQFGFPNVIMITDDTLRTPCEAEPHAEPHAEPRIIHDCRREGKNQQQCRDYIAVLYTMDTALLRLENPTMPTTPPTPGNDSVLDTHVLGFISQMTHPRCYASTVYETLHTIVSRNL